MEPSTSSFAAWYAGCLALFISLALFQAPAFVDCSTDLLVSKLTGTISTELRKEDTSHDPGFV